MNYSTDNTMSTALSVSTLIFVMLLVVVIYIYYAYCLSEIAKKTNTENAWYAWIPILNIVLMFQIARKSLWWLLAILVPLVNIFVIGWVWIKISEERRRPWWWGVLMIINPINLIILWFLAFREAPNEIVPEYSSPQIPVV